MYLLLRRFSILASKLWVCTTSLYFYTFFTYQFIPFLILSIILNYALLTIVLNRNAKLGLYSSIIFNVACLGYFKYFNFFSQNIDTALNLNIPHIDIIAPLAISFYTFQQISLAVSVYRKQTSNLGPVDYCAYILFFPKLISGPITDYEVISRQLNNRESYIGRYFAPAIFIFSAGLFKKIVMASYFGSIADQGYINLSTISTIDSWVTSLSYTMQLYFDFSGYTDMAIGSALLFGVILPINFNSPYKATDLQDFWRRWHITLSTWLRNFVYIPLGGNRKGDIRTYINLFLTFLIGGFWHGAGWNFLAWGALHGVGLVVHRYWSQSGFKMPAVLGWFITFNYVNITWIFFRTENLTDARNILYKMFPMHFSSEKGVIFNQPFAESLLLQSQHDGMFMLAACLMAVLICLIPFNTNSIVESAKSKQVGFVTDILRPAIYSLGLCIAIIVSLGGAAPGSFIYFNF
ncbi:MBOAT family protein [Ewingella americana]|uniref:Probable alginate O-acetylase n=2 Tax=Ewingella americana TaxID=41202 RepID=A0A085GBQ2_EWIA3|nr:MBOAT family protein [Ewingella americana]KFC81147.1 putative poly(beta-D-mannuronate) O-acetylase [Ewingella americana ATCC 33852]